MTARSTPRPLVLQPRLPAPALSPQRPAGPGHRATRALRLAAQAALALACLSTPAAPLGRLVPGCEFYSTQQWATPHGQCEVPSRALGGGVIRWTIVPGRVSSVTERPNAHGAHGFEVEGLGHAKGIQVIGWSPREPVVGEAVPILVRSIYFMNLLKDETEPEVLGFEWRQHFRRLAEEPLPRLPDAVRRCEFIPDKHFDPRRNCILPEGASGLGWTFIWDAIGTVVEAPTQAETTRAYKFKAVCDGVVLDGVSWRRPRLGAGVIFIVSRTHFAGELPPRPRMPSREELRRLGAEAKRSLSFHCAEGP